MIKLTTCLIAVFVVFSTMSFGQIIEMVYVEGGEFKMGSKSGKYDETPIQPVTLSSFNIGKYEVTQAQWSSIMASKPSFFVGCENCPVEQVSWNEVQEFIRKLNAKTGKNYRLPTEAEWEYAARGGQLNKKYKYSGSNDFNLVAWFDYNSGGKTQEVGMKKANELGIHDMSGNVMEWCSDWYRNHYINYKVSDPTGSFSGESRVYRGGSWSGIVDMCCTTRRNYAKPDSRSNMIGFRLVLPAAL
jgi:sulfatase modifying factor 1